MPFPSHPTSLSIYYGMVSSFNLQLQPLLLGCDPLRHGVRRYLLHLSHTCSPLGVWPPPPLEARGSRDSTHSAILLLADECSLIHRITLRPRSEALAPMMLMHPLEADPGKLHFNKSTPTISGFFLSFIPPLINCFNRERCGADRRGEMLWRSGNKTVPTGRLYALCGRAVRCRPCVFFSPPSPPSPSLSRY
ncbi:hypothetical protein BGZ63DRAFT_200517 [Mariannaea sp. PMI_226]|nr:hypothetical protein BGZ63DRAFT_200517 [Mariannaea sp. PMI_226]